jgi:hypothetical protein
MIIFCAAVAAHSAKAPSPHINTHICNGPVSATGTLTGVIEAARHTHQPDTHIRGVSGVRVIDSTHSPSLTARIYTAPGS